MKNALAKVSYKSKIVKYGLIEAVKDLIKQGKSYPQIAQECNNILASRGDGQDYDSVSTNNIWTFYSRVKDLMSEDERKVVNDEVELIDVVTKLHEMIKSFDEKMKDAFDEENIPSIVKLHRELHNDLKLLANIEGKLQSKVSIEVFTSNVMKIIEIIQLDNELENRSKRRLIQKIQDAVTLDTSQTADLDTAITKSLTEGNTAG